MIDFTTLPTPELQTLKVENQQIAAQRYGVTMGRLAQARGNVKKINAILRERGALVDAKARQAQRDTSGHVAAAVAPLKAAAIENAEIEAGAYVARVVAQFAGKDLDAVAPRPHSRMSRNEYKAAQARISAILDVLTVQAKRMGFRDPSDPQILVRDLDRETRLIDNAGKAMAADFDSYVAKLEGKVGEGVTGARVDGRYLWLGSTLWVQKGAQAECWRTQQIINYSVLGKAFNQWPTRLIK